MQLTVTKNKNYALIELAESIDGFDHAKLQETLYELEKEKQLQLIINMKGVQYINSTAIATLCHCAVDFREHGGNLYCVALPDNVKNVFDCLNASALLTICDTVKEAVKKLPKAP